MIGLICIVYVITKSIEWNRNKTFPRLGLLGWVVFVWGCINIWLVILQLSARLMW